MSRLLKENERLQTFEKTSFDTSLPFVSVHLFRWTMLSCLGLLVIEHLGNRTANEDRPENLVERVWRKSDDLIKELTTLNLFISRTSLRVDPYLLRRINIWSGQFCTLVASLRPQGPWNCFIVDKNK